ncbi:MAG: hypothetical protein ACRENA_04330 [Vulcanimicrobiaceae bacterium]
MRFSRSLSLALLAAGILCLGASPSFLPPPRVVVFPFTVNGDAQQDAGDRLAVIFAQQMSDAGVHVVAPVPGTQRAEFLNAARKLDCDYYITGFITPLGAEVTLVEQVVSTTSGTVIASNSAQLLTYADANGQGSLLASLVKRHAERAFAPLNDTAAAAQTPEPKMSGAETSLSKLGNIFKRKPKAAPSPSPSPSASP